MYHFRKEQIEVFTNFLRQFSIGNHRKSGEELEHSELFALYVFGPDILFANECFQLWIKNCNIAVRSLERKIHVVENLKNIQIGKPWDKLIVLQIVFAFVVFLF